MVVLHRLLVAIYEIAQMKILKAAIYLLSWFKRWMLSYKFSHNEILYVLLFFLPFPPLEVCGVYSF